MQACGMGSIMIAQRVHPQKPPHVTKRDTQSQPELCLVLFEDTPTLSYLPRNPSLKTQNNLQIPGQAILCDSKSKIHEDPPKQDETRILDLGRPYDIVVVPVDPSYFL